MSSVSAVSLDAGRASTCSRDYLPTKRGPVVAATQQVAPASRQPAFPSGRNRDTWLLIGGLVAFGAALLWFAYSAVSRPGWGLAPVDMGVYRDAGLVVRHVPPLYHPHLASPLYDRFLYNGEPFDYPPFAALPFALMSYLSLRALAELAAVVDVIAVLGAIWVTFGALGYRRGAGRAGLTLLTAAAVFYIEPVQRTMYLGQVEIVLMALVMWDMCQPDSRWWKGAGVGLAAGIKLLPLLFIPYLLLTRRFRQAAVAGGAFAMTVLIGFAADPADSVRWWFGGLFVRGSRTGFVGWEGNQSLLGLITRLTGSVAAGQRLWIPAAVAVVVLGLAAAVLLDRAGHRVVAVLACALTGLLASPISWDHHWVWVVPAVAVAVGYAARSRGRARLAFSGLAVIIAGVFFGWPGSLWGEPNDLGGFSLGLIWAPPNTVPGTYYRLGDRPWFAEYHWHGLQLLSGNLYVLAGIGLFVLLVVTSVMVTRHRPVAARQASPTALASSRTGAHRLSMS